MRGGTYTESLFDAAGSAKVIQRSLLEQVSESIQGLKPLEGIRCTEGVATGCWGERTFTSLRNAASALRSDIAAFKASNSLDNVVVVDLTPTAPIPPDAPSHHSLKAFEAGLDEADPIDHGEHALLLRSVQGRLRLRQLHSQLGRSRLAARVVARVQSAVRRQRWERRDRPS